MSIADVLNERNKQTKNRLKWVKFPFSADIRNWSGDADARNACYFAPGVACVGWGQAAYLAGLVPTGPPEAVRIATLTKR